MNHAAHIPGPTDLAQAESLIHKLAARTVRHDVRSDGKRVCWHSIGHGTPLVLIHGGHGSWLHWIRNVDALADRHALWLPDLPSFGDSDTMAPPADLDQLVGATLATLNRLVGADTAINLAGFSFGGLVAANLAARRGNVTRMALVGPAGHGTQRRLTMEMVNWRSSTDQDAMLADLRHNLQALMLHDENNIDALALAVHRDACLHTRFRTKALSHSASLLKVLTDFTSPLLFAFGEHDVTAIPEIAGPLLVDGRPQRSWATIADAGHWMQYERAHEANRLLLQFFEHGQR
jgi:pimeloyl-ACP methyl ester carboxylesterase